MIVQKYSRVFHTETRPAATGVKLPEEGVVMTFQKEGLETVVNACTGAAGEVFAGIAQMRNSQPLMLPIVEEFVIAAGETVDLVRLPMVGQILVTLDGVKQDIVASDTVALNEAVLTVQSLAFEAGAAGKVVVQYMYEPTVVEARQHLGDVAIGGLAQHEMGDVGLITSGEVATTYFDASDDWSGVINEVYMGAGGIFTTDNSGELAEGVIVTAGPSAGVPYLTVRVKA